MHYIFRTKVVFILLLCALFASDLSGQIRAKGNYNYLDFQKKPYYFGLSLGYNNSGFLLNQSGFFINNDSIRITEGSRASGLDVHMIANLKIGEYFDFRFLPGFSFGTKILDFTSVLEENEVKRWQADPVYFELPFHIRFKSTPYKDKRIFAIVGMKYSYDVASNSEARQAKTLLRISPHDFQAEVGVGMQFFFPFFIFSPEIKYSRGIGNVLIYDSSVNQSRVLEQIRTSVFTLSFHFEG